MSIQHLSRVPLVASEPGIRDRSDPAFGAQRAWGRRWAGVLTATTMCVAYLVVRPASVDFASGDFRARLYSHGAYAWNNAWFGGHPTPGFGMVSTMLGSWFGVVPMAIASVLVGTWCLTLLVERCVELRPTLADPTLTTVLLAIGCSLNIWSGRLTFGPSVAFAAASVLALQRRRPVIAVLCAVACGLSSPVAAVSLAIVLAGCWAAGVVSRTSAAATAIAAVLPVAVVGTLFYEGGHYPFTAGGLALLGSALAVVAWTGRRERVIVWTVIAYAAAALVAFTVSTPLGGNIVRLGWLAAGPVVALTWRRRRRALFHVLIVLSVLWGWSYAKMAFQSTDSNADPHFYDSLAVYVNSLPGGVQRVEVVPTETYREADELAFKISLARGWETQIDRRFNPEMYNSNLTSDDFRQWLTTNAISLVALPTGRLQDIARREAELINDHPDYLKPVWSNDDWHVFEVISHQTLAGNGATVIQVEPEALHLEAQNVGISTVRFRYTSLYRVTTGDACVTRSTGGWIELHVYEPGPITLDIDVTPASLFARHGTCP